MYRCSPFLVCTHSLSLCCTSNHLSASDFSDSFYFSQSVSQLVFAADERGGLCYQLFLCGLGHKKHPVLWMWKEPVFNFWETHKSLSLLSYLPQNWKQMLPFFIRLWTGQLWSCENKNHPVNLSCSLFSFFTPFFSSFFVLTPLSLISLLRSLVFVFFLSSLLTRLCRRCACVLGGSVMSKSKPRALRKLAKCNPAAIRHDAGKRGLWSRELRRIPRAHNCSRPWLWSLQSLLPPTRWRVLASFRERWREREKRGGWVRDGVGN